MIIHLRYSEHQRNICIGTHKVTSLWPEQVYVHLLVVYPWRDVLNPGGEWSFSWCILICRTRKVNFPPKIGESMPNTTPAHPCPHWFHTRSIATGRQRFQTDSPARRPWTDNVWKAASAQNQRVTVLTTSAQWAPLGQPTMQIVIFLWWYHHPDVNNVAFFKSIQQRIEWRPWWN